MKSHELIN